MTSENPSLPLAILDSQTDYTLSGQAAKEGSVAIANGRTAGLALECGLPLVAARFEAALPTLPDMPNLTTLYVRYIANPKAFAAFGDKKDFSAGGTAFSNAAGSYGFLRDYLSRGDAALAGSTAQSVCSWGADALRAAGFPEKAAAVEHAWQQRPAAQIAADSATSAEKIDLAELHSPTP